MADTSPSSGGRGAHERILAAARKAFRTHGMVATQMEAIAVAAPVSKRTLYKHFPDKGALILAYLQERDRQMFDVQLSGEGDPREQILDLFCPPGTGGPIATCPFIAAATEYPETGSAPHQLAAHHKRAFRDRLEQLAAAVGVPDPVRVGSLLALLYDGAISRAHTLNDPAPLQESRKIAAELLDAAHAPGVG